ncbi:hypothetical protein FB451DRAFT_1181488 [Mycena latifolia]|nr:hypothetical protein FB451DRAFT_1181488 [Mycena latifolia]
MSLTIQRPLQKSESSLYRMVFKECMNEDVLVNDELLAPRANLTHPAPPPPPPPSAPVLAGLPPRQHLAGLDPNPSTKPFPRIKLEPRSTDVLEPTYGGVDSADEPTFHLVETPGPMFLDPYLLSGPSSEIRIRYDQELYPRDCNPRGFKHRKGKGKRVYEHERPVASSSKRQRLHSPDMTGMDVPQGYYLPLDQLPERGFLTESSVNTAHFESHVAGASPRSKEGTPDTATEIVTPQGTPESRPPIDDLVQGFNPYTPVDQKGKRKQGDSEDDPGTHPCKRQRGRGGSPPQITPSRMVLRSSSLRSLQNNPRPLVPALSLGTLLRELDSYGADVPVPSPPPEPRYPHSLRLPPQNHEYSFELTEQGPPYLLPHPMENYGFSNRPITRSVSNMLRNPYPSGVFEPPQHGPSLPPIEPTLVPGNKSRTTGKYIPRKSVNKRKGKLLAKAQKALDDRDWSEGTKERRDEFEESSSRSRERTQVAASDIQCTKCNTTFTRKSDLKRHIKISQCRDHIDRNELKLVCSCGPRIFSRRDALLRHKRDFCKYRKRHRHM